MLTLPMIGALSITMVGTAFLSGIFGMAGGMILMGILMALLPLPAAMVLHGVAQLSSNGWRAWLWRGHIQPRIFLEYVIGGAMAMGLWTLAAYVPSKPVAFILLGLTPFLARAVPKRWALNAAEPGMGVLCGLLCICLQLVAGVTGPLLDSFFVRSGLDRRQIVATKAAVQVFGHMTKLVYFGLLIEEAASVEPYLVAIAVATAVIGTTLGKRVLEAMSDVQFMAWTQRLITTIGLVYIGQGVWLLL